MTAMEFGMWADFEGKRLGDCGGRTGQFLVAFSGEGTMESRWEKMVPG